MKIDGSNRCFGLEGMGCVYQSISMDMLSMPRLTLRSESSISVLIRVVAKEASLTMKSRDLVDHYWRVYQ